jgi:hypothetical protein
MAKQEFLNGGFIGKLGQVVGQHWHNQRIVRSMAIPSNPRSDKQRAARGTFAQAISLAQQALAFNGHNGDWDTTSHSEFQARTQQALKHLHAGDSPEIALPLYPDGKTPPKPPIIGSAVIADDYNLHITLSEPLVDPVADAYCYLQDQSISGYYGETTTDYLDPTSTPTEIILARYEDTFCGDWMALRLLVYQVKGDLSSSKELMIGPTMLIYPNTTRYIPTFSALLTKNTNSLYLRIANTGYRWSDDDGCEFLFMFRDVYGVERKKFITAQGFRGALWETTVNIASWQIDYTQNIDVILYEWEPNSRDGQTLLSNWAVTLIQ